MSSLKNKHKKYFVFLLLFLFISFLSFLLVQYTFLEKKEIAAILEVGKIPAFNLDNSTFSFGTINSNASTSRSIKIENNYPFPIIAHISSKGNISDFLFFEKRIELLPEEEKLIVISAISSEKKEYGNYSGSIIILLKRSS